MRRKVVFAGLILIIAAAAVLIVVFSGRQKEEAAEVTAEPVASLTAPEAEVAEAGEEDLSAEVEADEGGAQEAAAVAEMEPAEQLKEKIWIKDEETLTVEGDAETLFAQAERYEYTEYGRFAEQVYKKIASDYAGTEDGQEALRRLLVLHVSAGNRDKAEAVYREAGAYAFGGGVAAAAVYDMEVTARCYERDGYGERAEPIYKKIAAKLGVSDYGLEAQKRLVKLYIALGEEREAEAAFAELLAKFSGHAKMAEAVNEIGASYVEHKNYEKAKEVYAYVLVKWPEAECAVWSQKGVVVSNICLDKIESAESGTDELVEKFWGDESLVQAVREIGEQYRVSEKHANAREVFDYILETWPESVFAMWSQMGLVKLCISEGNQRCADEGFAKLVENYRDRERVAEGVFSIALHYGEFKNQAKAYEAYEWIVENWPDCWLGMWAQSRVTRTNISMGDYEAAEAGVEQLLARFSQHERIGETFYDIGQSYYQVGQYEYARKYYELVFKKWPDFRKASWARIGLAQTYLALGNNKAAEAVLDELVGQYSSQTYLPAEGSEAYLYAGDCYRRMGEYRKAIKCYERIANDCPEHEAAGQALFMVGHNYEKLQKSGGISESEGDSKIRAAYERLVERYPDCDSAASARRWLRR
jgi:TolA-binding protein